MIESVRVISAKTPKTPADILERWSPTRGVSASASSCGSPAQEELLVKEHLHFKVCEFSERQGVEVTREEIQHFKIQRNPWDLFMVDNRVSCVFQHAKATIRFWRMCESSR